MFPGQDPCGHQRVQECIQHRRRKRSKTVCERRRACIQTCPSPALQKFTGPAMNASRIVPKRDHDRRCNCCPGLLPTLPGPARDTGPGCMLPRQMACQHFRDRRLSFPCRPCARFQDYFSCLSWLVAIRRACDGMSRLCIAGPPHPAATRPRHVALLFGVPGVHLSCPGLPPGPL